VVLPSAMEPPAAGNAMELGAAGYAYSVQALLRSF